MIIAQCSPPHSGSTVLANLLQGLFYPDNNLVFDNENLLHKNTVVKTHKINLDFWFNKYPNLNLFCVCSQRKKDKYHPNIDIKYYDYKKVLIFDYEEINKTEDYYEEDIVDNFLKKCFNFFPKEILKEEKELCKKNVLKRFYDMNDFYETIKNTPFGNYNNKFLLHGHHRNRKF